MKTAAKKATSKTAPAGAKTASRSSSRSSRTARADQVDSEAANADATAAANAGTTNANDPEVREQTHQSGGHDPAHRSTEETVERTQAREIAGGPVSLTPAGVQEVLGKSATVGNKSSGKGKAKAAVGDRVLFTRTIGQGKEAEKQSFVAIVSGINEAQKAEAEELSADEQKEAAGFSQKDLDDRNLTRDGDTVKRRFPRAEQPETVNLHVLVPNAGAPMQFVEAVPFDEKGESGTSWRSLE